MKRFSAATIWLCLCLLISWAGPFIAAPAHSLSHLQETDTSLHQCHWCQQQSQLQHACLSQQPQLPQVATTVIAPCLQLRSYASTPQFHYASRAPPQHH
ncbi:hypothetical protein [Shewanella sp. NFH-SH190041]|uniref:hypothetical protein n=1 Tax=Shewanella sp. NFH-SH190041 TaxID=2950245 RepID=UPI0021C282C8|nr:hypothetical protein [Shewanella sp. NFH-SH190041]